MVIRPPSPGSYDADPRRPPVSVLSVLAWLIAAGLCAFIPYQLYWVELAQSRNSLSWPSTMGRVTYCSAEHILWRGGYAVHVWYTYRANGERHEGRRIGWGFATDLVATPWQVNDIKHRYAMGKDVRVYYDPTASQNARLEPGTIYDPYVPVYLIVGGAATVLLAGFGLSRLLPGKTRD